MLAGACPARALTPQQHPIARILKSIASERHVFRCQGGVLPYTGIAVLLGIASLIPTEYGPLFMAAGDIDGMVGDSIGFIGNIPYPHNTVESTIRSTFCFTVFWIPFTAIMGACAIGEGLKDPRIQLSVSRGVSGGTRCLARALVHVACIPPFYLLSCLPAFLVKLLLQHNQAISPSAAWLFFIYAAANAFLLCAVFTVSGLIASIIRSSIASTFLSLLPHLGTLLSYPSQYALGSTSKLWWMCPTTWLMHSCSLNLPRQMPPIAIAYSSVLIAISLVLLYVVSSHQEAC